MDRDNRWDRVEKAYKALTKGEVPADSAVSGIQASYDNGKTDEFVEPFVVMKDGAPTATIKTGDSVIFFNFRPDRARDDTLSATTVSTILTAANALRQPMSASLTTTIPFRTNWWLSGKKLSRIRSASGLPPII